MELRVEGSGVMCVVRGWESQDGISFLFFFVEVGIMERRVGAASGPLYVFCIIDGNERATSLQAQNPLTALERGIPVEASQIKTKPCGAAWKEGEQRK